MHQFRASGCLPVTFLSAVSFLLCEPAPIQAQLLAKAQDDTTSPHASPESFIDGYWSLCDSYGCSASPGPSMVEQLAFLAGCFSGPGSANAYECRCADLSADSHITLWDFAVFQNHPMPICERELSLAQMPGLGYCPSPGTIFRANDFEAFDGTVLLVGTLVAEGDPNVDECIYESAPGCFIAIPFPPIVLTSQEISTLDAKLDAIPTTFPDCCNYAWDPCIIRHLSFGGRTLSDYCWGCDEADAYRGRIRNVFTFLEQIANR